MLFTDIIFAPFLIITLLAFYSARNHFKAQLIILLFASFIFYSWWSVKFFGLIIISSILDFILAHLIYSNLSLIKKRIFLCLSLTWNLGLLFYFKYANFFISNIQTGLLHLGIHVDWPTLNVILPIGISFYTFQSLSYTIDIYRGIIKPEKSLLKYLVFVTAFPQFVAGPIVRAIDLLPQLQTNLCKKINEIGLYYILYGLLKKTLLADTLGHYFVDPIFQNPQNFSSLDLVFGVYCFAFQLFFDFSGYSDIAIGLGYLLGLQLPTNFQWPYSARNSMEFWHRWHMSLMNWLREYVYFPLGGNRVNAVLWLRNIVVIFLLSGLWHGANWTFIVWAGLHCIYYVIYSKLERSNLKIYSKLPDPIKTFIFFNLVCLTYIFFRSPDLHFAFDYIHQMFSSHLLPSKLDHKKLIVLGIASLITHSILEPRLKGTAERFTKLHWALRGGFIFAFFILMSFMAEKGIAHQAFIYFQF